MRRTRFVLTRYIREALAQAVCEKLEDGSYAGRIPPCPGVVAFGPTQAACLARKNSRLFLKTGFSWVCALGTGYP